MPTQNMGVVLDDRKLTTAKLALCGLAIQMKNFQDCDDSDNQSLFGTSESSASEDFEKHCDNQSKVALKEDE